MLFGGVGIGNAGAAGLGTGWTGIGITGAGAGGTGSVGAGKGTVGGPPGLSVWAGVFETTNILTAVRDRRFRIIFVFILYFSLVVCFWLPST